MVGHSFEQEPYGITFFITYGPGDFFRFFSDVFVDTDDAGIFPTAKQGGLEPMDIVGDAFLEKPLFNHSFAVHIGNFAEFNFIVDL